MVRQHIRGKVVLAVRLEPGLWAERPVAGIGGLWQLRTGRVDVQLSIMAEPRDDQVGWEELTRSECFGFLASKQVGRIAVVDDVGPLVVPVNYVLDRYTVVFRTDEGTKLDAAGRHSAVAFEIDEIDVRTRTGWSVLLRGEATEVSDLSELERLRDLSLEPWAPGAKARYARILPAVVSGRRISAPGRSSGGRASPPHDDLPPYERDQA